MRHGVATTFLAMVSNLLPFLIIVFDEKQIGFLFMKCASKWQMEEKLSESILVVFMEKWKFEKLSFLKDDDRKRLEHLRKKESKDLDQIKRALKLKLKLYRLTTFS